MFDLPSRIKFETYFGNHHRDVCIVLNELGFYNGRTLCEAKWNIADSLNAIYSKLNNEATSLYYEIDGKFVIKPGIVSGIQQLINNLKELLRKNNKRNSHHNHDHSTTSDTMSDSYTEPLTKRRKNAKYRILQRVTLSSRNDQSFSENDYMIPYIPIIPFQNSDDETILIQYESCSRQRILHFIQAHLHIQESQAAQVQRKLLEEFRIYSERLYQFLQYVRNNKTLLNDIEDKVNNKQHQQQEKFSYLIEILKPYFNDFKSKCQC